jgi:hypothetical protein
VIVAPLFGKNGIELVHGHHWALFIQLSIQMNPFLAIFYKGFRPRFIFEYDNSFAHNYWVRAQVDARWHRNLVMDNFPRAIVTKKARLHTELYIALLRASWSHTLGSHRCLVEQCTRCVHNGLERTRAGECVAVEGQSVPEHFFKQGRSRFPNKDLEAFQALVSEPGYAIRTVASGFGGKS